MKDMNRNTVLIVLGSSTVVGGVWAYIADAAGLDWPGLFAGGCVIGPLLGFALSKLLKG